MVESASQREHGVDLETRARVSRGAATVLIDCVKDRPAGQWLSIMGTEGSIDFPDDPIVSHNAGSRLTIVDYRGSRADRVESRSGGYCKQTSQP